MDNVNLSAASYLCLDSSTETIEEMPAPASRVVLEKVPLAIRAPSTAATVPGGHKVLVMHAQFLQDVLAEVMTAFNEDGQASVKRLSQVLTRYWDACFARRDTRLEIMRLAEGSAIEQNLEPMGRPFIYMVVSELWPKYGTSAPSIAGDIYWAARALALDEAFSGKPDIARRNELLARL